MAEREDDKQEELSERTKRPYSPPSVEEVAAFETLALSCASLPGNTDCYGGYKFS